MTNEEIYQDIIDWLDNILIEQPRQTQIDIVKICGVTRQAVSGWFKTGRVREVHLLTIAKHYGIEPPKSLQIQRLIEINEQWKDLNPMGYEIIQKVMEDCRQQNWEKLEKVLQTYKLFD